jgi:catalase
MAFYNQGARPNYQSSIQPLSYKPTAYTTADHEKYIGAAVADLSFITELDFEQPRELWSRVFTDDARARFVGNVAGHFGAVKSAEVKARTLSVL